ncbi:hypothetical protein DPX39_070036400 [Trypanosoma brucei equiperdum]|uniref:Uncharacterized protein n=1 Tax=Trypanosoma brucei equiperdum TaxID=630700 RepID=A0A3L6L563_9TRYP|nr:hypothetical protein DPX39_070036400 [Trypanosoma brucei equiperdum]
MSKAPSQPAKKWMSARTLAKSEDATNRKSNTAAPASQPSQQPASVMHERPTPPPPAPVQLPQSVFFERQEAVDTLSNLYRNAQSVKKIETGSAAFEARDISKVHEELMDCLRPAAAA